MFLLEVHEVSREETRVVGRYLSSSEDRMIDRSLSSFDSMPECDRLSDGRTDGFIISIVQRSSAYSKLSADALKN